MSVHVTCTFLNVILLIRMLTQNKDIDEIILYNPLPSLVIPQPTPTPQYWHVVCIHVCILIGGASMLR